jgi:diguanylate cyclase (GGDEF)-like protein
MGEEYSRVYGALPSHDGLVAGERACFGMDHSDASAILAGQWKLPPVLAVPMGAHHDPSKLADPGLKRLAEAVCVASRCADVFVDAEPAEAIADVRRLCKETFNLAEDDCDALMNDVGTRAKEIAPLFEISMGTFTTYDDILKRATETLVELEKKGKASAPAVPATNTSPAAPEAPDALARLANRERFDAFLNERLSAAAQSGADLSLLLIDLDNFKEIIAQHSQTVGEGLLRAVAAIVSSTARAEDLAARYSGEQIALVLTDMNRAAAITIAEQLRRCIAAKPLPGSASVSLPITVSIGVANFEPGGALKNRAHLTKALELALHAARQSGRNCVRVFKLPRSPVAAA